MKKPIVMLTTAVLATALAMPAFAADQAFTADAQLRADFSIVMDGNDVDFKTSSGNAVYPILYEDRTYLPLRAIGELMGKNVNWDEDNKTITISGTRDTVSSNRDNPNIGRKNIRVQERPDFTIVVDGKERKFYAANGARLNPILYNGSTYLPLRAIGELMGNDVSWDAKNKVVTLTGEYTVTDADSFVTEQDELDQGYIGRESAKNIALGYVNLLEKDVTFLTAALTYRDSRWVYDVEFYTDSGEYDLIINAETGRVLDYDYDIDNWKRPSAEVKDIGLAKAKDIALDDAGLREKDVTFVRTRADYDDGRKVYEIEFYTNKGEYDYEINAETGKILDVDYDAEAYTPEKDKVIGIDEAKQIALKHASVAQKNAKWVKAELDRDDDSYKYEVEFRVGRTEYEYEIDAMTGKILDWDKDYDD